MQDIVSIDGVYYDVIIPENGIKRSFSVADTDQAGRNVTGAMIRDIIGTFYNYTISMKIKNRSDYDALYEILSAPDDYHIITVPYGQYTLTFKAYVTEGEDTLRIKTNSYSDWTELSINFIAMEPLRKPS